MCRIRVRQLRGMQRASAERTATKIRAVEFRCTNLMSVPFSRHNAHRTCHPRTCRLWHPRNVYGHPRNVHGPGAFARCPPRVGGAIRGGQNRRRTHAQKNAGKTGRKPERESRKQPERASRKTPEKAGRHRKTSSRKKPENAGRSRKTSNSNNPENRGNFARTLRKKRTVRGAMIFRSGLGS